MSSNSEFPGFSRFHATGEFARVFRRRAFSALFLCFLALSAFSLSPFSGSGAEQAGEAVSGSAPAAPSVTADSTLSLLIVPPAQALPADGDSSGADSSAEADGAPRGAVRVEAEVAADTASRARGFMFRKEIPAGTGMIFVYPRDERLSFWMKNTGVPLSIAFIDSRGVLREIFDMEPFSLAPVQSGGYRRYALEVPRGWFAENGISAGHRFSPETLAALKSLRVPD